MKWLYCEQVEQRRAVVVCHKIGCKWLTTDEDCRFIPKQKKVRSKHEHKDAETDQEDKRD